jgi:hypothetical protein
LIVRAMWLPTGAPRPWCVGRETPDSGGWLRGIRQLPYGSRTTKVLSQAIVVTNRDPYVSKLLPGRRLPLLMRRQRGGAAENASGRSHRDRAANCCPKQSPRPFQHEHVVHPRERDRQVRYLRFPVTAPSNSMSHQSFILVVGTRPGQRNRPQRNPCRSGLRRYQSTADAVHGHPIGRFIERRQQAVTSYSARCRITWRLHALSLPLLHDSRMGFIMLHRENVPCRSACNGWRGRYRPACCQLEDHWRYIHKQ